MKPKNNIDNPDLNQKPMLETEPEPFFILFLYTSVAQNMENKSGI